MTTVTTADGVQILYEDLSGESNVVTISGGGGSAYTIEDSAAITPGGACTPDLSNARAVSCPSADVFQVKAALNDGADTLELGDLLRNQAFSYPPKAPPTPPPIVFPVVVEGGEGSDNFAGAAGPDQLIGGPGIDTFAGGGGDDSIAGDAGDDIAQGGAGNDIIAGGPDSDVLRGGGDQDVINGGDGDDKLYGGAGNDRLKGDAGNDQLDFPTPNFTEDPTPGVDTLDGGPGDDELSGGPATSAQYGDTFIGGDGTDDADFGLRTSALTITLDGTADDGQLGENDNVGADVENLIAGSGNDTIVGSPAPNFLDGRLGTDHLHGGEGNDTLEGGLNDPNNDYLYGEGGSDTLTGRAGDDTLDGGPGNDLVLSGEGGSDTIRGGDGDDTLDGGTSNDVLEGGPGRDTLEGGDGDDKLDGGAGPDELRGGPGTDTVRYDDRSTDVTATIDGNPDDGTDGKEGDNLAPDVENVIGGARDDTLRGNASANVLKGEAGEDLVEGGSAVDDLDGGAAPDLILAKDNVGDTIDCGLGHDLVVVDSADNPPQNCDTIDRPGAGPKVRTTARITGVTQPVGLRLPQGRHFYRDLPGQLLIPFDSAIDARERKVVLATAKKRGGGLQEVTVSEGAFAVSQTKGSKPVTELTLLAGARKSCSSRSKSARAAMLPNDPPGKVRTTVGKKHRGAFRVVGKYSRGAAEGTSWTTVETCGGTRTIVHSGVVRVTPCNRKKAVEVRPGHPYTVKKRRCTR